MKTLLQKNGISAPAFTLIEMMVVMAIIAVLAGLTVGGMGYYKQKMANGQTEVLIASIERALEDYKTDNGSYPAGADTTVVFTALYGDGSNVYLDTLNPNLTGKALNVVGGQIIDGWGNNLGYTSPGTNNPANDYDLWSWGADGINNTSDDIKNW